jgi:tetracycline 7-halogenase / FADH2 O2-dependent halogenase
MTRSATYDVVILGSGFGGSLTAAILGRAGLSVAMVDRRRHPRFVIGESSTPAADFILHDLAQRHDLPELFPLTRFGSWRKTYPGILCGCKRGFTYFWHGNEGGFRPSADHRHELFVTANASQDVADTQWYRPDVDQFFAGVAQNRSAQLLEEANIISIEHQTHHSWSLVLDQHGVQRRLQAKFLIDASGPAGVLPRYLRLQDQAAQLQTDSSAVYGHWEGLPPYEDWLRDQGAKIEDYPFPADDSAMHHVFRDGWGFQLRFANGLTSLGSVFAPSHRADRDRPLEEIITRDRPALTKILARARQAEFPGQLFQTGRMQRLWNSGAGTDWAALPFTVGFIDALHSTGIAHNLSGIERLVEILLRSSAERAAELQDYSRQVIAEVRLIDLLVAGCYRGLADFRLFATWSMLYFAAATSFEKRRVSDSGRDAGFLMAADGAFVTLVRGLYDRLQELVCSSGRLTEHQIGEFEQQVKTAILPYNHVGLFAPEVPNMYRYTSAEKH